MLRKPVILAVVCVSVTVALVWALYWVLNKPAEDGSVLDNSLAPSENSVMVSVIEAGLVDTAGIIGFGALEAAGGVVRGQQNQESLQKSVEKAFTAYLAESYDPLIDFMISSGIDVPEGYSSRPDISEQLWNRWHHAVSGAQFDVGHILVRPGGLEDVPRTGYSHRTAVRQGSRPSVDSIPPQDRVAVEVVVPGIFTASDNTNFAGRLGMDFILDHEGNWVLVRIIMYNIPVGKGFPPLPI